MDVTLDWLGCATFRLTVGDTVIFLDSYIDRAPTAPDVGLRTADVDRADFVLVGHSHFDHLAGAEVIAQRTGARIIGSNETCRVMKNAGVPIDQLLPSQGGEHHRLSPDITVRVFPSLHACIWAGARGALDDVCEGDLGLTEDERRASFAANSPFGGAASGANPDEMRALMEHARAGAGSPRDGGALVYLIETPAGSVFFQDTSGCWRGIFDSIRPDVAILAVSGRPNDNGEPYQGSLADFIAMEAGLLRAQTIVPGHHDNWGGMSAHRPTDFTALRLALAREGNAAVLIEPSYLAGTRLFD